MDFWGNFYKEYKTLLSENKIVSEDKLKENHELFKNNFGPDKLKSLDGEVLLETMFNHGNKGSLVYWLEFKNDEEFQSGLFGGIGGGSALKFGIYKRKEDGKWITGHSKDMKEISIAEAISIARERRDLLVKGADLVGAISNDFSDDTYLKLQDDIDKELGNFGNLAWVHKYFRILYPDRIDDIHSVDWLSSYLIKMHIKPVKIGKRYALAGQYVRLAKQAKMSINHFTATTLSYFGPVHNYWRIETTDDQKSYWSEMQQNGHVAIGWTDLGDLRQFDDLKKSEAKEQIKKLLEKEYPNITSGIGKSANQILTFYRNIKPNDAVVAVEGQKVLDVGKVVGEYEYKDGLQFPHCFNVRWFECTLDKLPNPTEGLLTTINQYKDIENLIAIEETLSKKSKNSLQKNFPELSHDEWSTVKNPKRFWLYAPGYNASMWDEFYSKGIMGLWRDEMGDLKQYSNKESMKTTMKQLYGEDSSYKNEVHAAWQFCNEVNDGDIVYVKKGLYNIIGRGIVQSGYIFDSNRSQYKHIRKVKWTHEGKWEHPGKAVIKTLTDITPYTEYVQKLESIFIEEDESFVIALDETEVTYNSYTEDNFLEEVFMEESKYATLVNLLKLKKNVILQGAPGVGKTFIAKRLAYSIMGKKDFSRVMMVQFHQSYSYEDFIIGYRPAKEGFELVTRPFYEFCKRAEDDDENDYFFIIDEINRGNLSKIFGELLMLIEKDKRGEQLRLLYSNQLFSVPRNLHIIGMMNTADRSLAIIDYALRRRFAFFDIEPAFDSDNFRLLIDKTNNPKFTSLVEQIKALNEFISNDESLGPGFRIGHSYLCTDEEINEEWLESVVKYEIIPLLSEYWFDDQSKLDMWANKLSNVVYD